MIAARGLFKTLSLIFGLFLFFLLAENAEAQVFSLNPSSGNFDEGNEFTVDLNIDTQDKKVASADVKLTYDSEALEVVKVEKGTFFSDEAEYIGTGKLFVGGFFRETYATKEGNGKLAILTLKGKRLGTVRLSFVCSTDKNDSNIFDASATDIIRCSGISDGSYVIRGGPEPTSTPRPTPTPTAGGPKPTKTPPVSGVTFPTFFLGGAGALIIILGIVMVLL